MLETSPEQLALERASLQPSPSSSTDRPYEQRLSHGVRGHTAPRAKRVVHLVGRLTDPPVFTFLLPATQAIAQKRVEQWIVMLDERNALPLRAQFDTRVRWACIPDEPGLLRRWKATRDTFRKVLEEQPPSAVHLHGVFQWLLGARMAKRANPKVRLFFSPHGSPLIGWSKALSGALVWVAHKLQGQSEEHTIVTLEAESRTLSAFGAGDIDVIESPVSQVFLETPLKPARWPLVVTSSRVDRPRSALTFAQLAVLLGDKSLGLAFNWIGTASRESRAALQAADVGVFDVHSDAERAQRLSSGWVFLAAGDAAGFPLLLVEAMALGMACVALETPYTRNVMRHGETGILCTNSTEIREAIARLIDSAETRQRLGAAARRDAEERFSEGRFKDSVLSTYSLTDA